MVVSSVLLSCVLAPLILVCSVVLLPFAIITTSLAISTLAVRVFAVYVELFIVIVHDHLSSFTPVASVPIATKRSKLGRRPSTSSGTHTPKPSQAAVYAPNAPLVRDYEGVGGWRFASEDDAENEWVTMNTRLELPAVSAIPEERKRKHQRSLTHGSAGERVFVRKHKTSSRPRSVVISGTVSPEDRLLETERTKSAVVLSEMDLQTSRARSRRRRKSSSSSTSSGSGRTLTMAGHEG